MVCINPCGIRQRTNKLQPAQPPTPVGYIVQTISSQTRFQDIAEMTELSWFYGSGILIGWALLGVSCVIKDLRRRPASEYLSLELEDVSEDDCSTYSRREGKLSWRKALCNLDYALVLLYPCMAFLHLTFLEIIQGPGWRREKENAYLVSKPIDVIWGRVWIFWVFHIMTESFWDGVAPNVECLEKIARMRTRTSRWRRLLSTNLFRLSVFGLFATTILFRVCHFQRFVVHYIQWQIDPIIINWGHLSLHGTLLQANFLALVFMAFILPFWTVVDIIVLLLNGPSHTDPESNLSITFTETTTLSTKFKNAIRQAFDCFFKRLDYWGYYILGATTFLFFNSLVRCLWFGIYRVSTQVGKEPDIRPPPRIRSLLQTEQAAIAIFGLSMIIIRSISVYRSFRVPWTSPLLLVTRKSSFRV